MCCRLYSIITCYLVCKNELFFEIGCRQRFLDWWPAIAQVCHRFYAILGPDSFLWEQIAKQLLFVNQSSSIFQLKIHTYLSAQLRFRVHKHWEKGVCLVKPIASIREKHVLPWLVLNSDVLWVGTGNHIRAYPRVPAAAFHHNKPFSGRVKPKLNLSGSRGDMGRFVVKDDGEDVVVAGDTNGSVFVWKASTGRLQFKETNCHSSDVASVKLFKNVIVSGGRDKFVKIFRFDNSNSVLNHSWKNQCAIEEIYLDDRILSLDIDPSGTLFCTGTAGHGGVPPSHLFDLATGALICPLRDNFRDGEGVYDMHFESPNELLTGDFNSALRLWDLRTQSNVSVWDDPHDSAINCIATDNNMTILTGTAAHGGVRLWDKRQTRCVQLYFVKPELRSPVYCLDFDSSELYVALDSSVLGFDFSGGIRKPIKDLVVYPCN
ncbi:F-box/WD repeat-containing protein 4-like isoform X2 [Daphnia pulicaria]|uniref:F-box/WD repeat-containing protein 4-like isoform X2 n=1 Tax=Daphnia pulicaria TaxID=35523 RepID=UPI001EEC6B72|nr:F-box/WD repeat-containing protein 4-like isoform X2 [Daphnia pulicaria]